MSTISDCAHNPLMLTYGCSLTEPGGGNMVGNMNASDLSEAPGGLSPAGFICRAAFYFDGFNLYHAIDELGQNHLKWLDLWSLSKKLLLQGHELHRVIWCSAAYTSDPQKLIRHRLYRKALESTGVECELGHFIQEFTQCKACGKRHAKRTEKQSDVNLAIRLIRDAYQDRYDTAYLVTADSDQSATARHFRDLFPDKKLISITPPGKPHSKDILRFAHGQRTIKQSAIEQNLFPQIVMQHGAEICRRPEAYDPPTASGT